jgi:hypothetical protein
MDKFVLFSIGVTMEGRLRAHGNKMRLLKIKNLAKKPSWHTCGDT